MHEYATVSSSSYDPASLAAKLTEKSADGWSVVAIVPTGGDVTAFLSRASSGSSTSAVAEQAPTPVAEPVIEVVAEPAPQPIVEVAPIVVASVPAPEPVVEPAGWAVAPEPAAPSLPQVQPAPVATYEPQPVVVPVVAPVAVAPAVPAGWYADPAGRFELRYWDGATWTEHVSRAGQQFTDPPVA
jgi:hypothetical protein